MTVFSRITSRVSHELKGLRLRTLASLVPHSVVSFLALSAAQKADPFAYMFDPSIIQWGDGSQARDQINRWGIIVKGTDFNKRVARESYEKVLATVEALEGVDGSEAAKSLGVEISDGTLSYAQLVNSDCPVFDFRRGVDQGMVDIFHADKMFPELSHEVTRVVQASGLLELLSEEKRIAFELTNFNVYLNRSVVDTRSWHVDSYGDTQYKAFIYLSDVLDLASGPYCYVPGSPGDRGFRMVNEVLAYRLSRHQTDVILYDTGRAIPLLGPAGTLVVSNQSGAHRGFPQEVGRSRCIVALNLRPRGTYRN